MSTYWYVQVYRVADFANGGRMTLGVMGGFFIELEKVHDEDGVELNVTRQAQARYDFIPANCSLHVYQIEEMPPEAFRDRFLSKEDLDALDRLDVEH